MKFKYTGNIPTVVLVNGDLKTFNKGDTISLPGPPTPQFVPEKIVFNQPVVAEKPRKTRTVKTDANNS